MPSSGAAKPSRALLSFIFRDIESTRAILCLMTKAPDSLPVPTTAESKHSPQSDELIAGAFSGTVSRLVTAPLDVLKIRSQLHFQGKPPGLFASFSSIVREEGFFALWKGNISAIILWVTYGMSQFYLYRVFKTWGEESHKNVGDKHSRNAFLRTSTLFLAGAAAAMVGNPSKFRL